jgi:hypothetical protein
MIREPVALDDSAGRERDHYRRGVPAADGFKNLNQDSNRTIVLREKFLNVHSD